MDLEVRHLRYFLALAEELSFTRAAAVLGIPQPALSTQIRRMERRLGQTLFHRTTRTVRLTADGESLIPTARQVVEAMTAIERAGEPPGGTARVRLATEDYMPLLLELATERLARTRLDYAVMEQSIALPLLSSGELDWFVGWDYPVCPAAVGPKLEVTIVAEERLCAYLPLDHPLSGRDGVRLAELRDDYWVARPAGSPHHGALKQYARDAGFDADIRYATADSHTAVNLLRAGSAVTYGSPLTRPGLGFAVVPFTDDLTHRLFTAVRRDRTSTQLCAAMLELLVEWRENIVRRRHDDAQSSEAVRALMARTQLPVRR